MHKGQGLSESLVYGRNVHNPTNICTALLMRALFRHLHRVSMDFVSTVPHLVYVTCQPYLPTTLSCQVLDTELMGNSTNKYTLCLTCQDVTRYSQNVSYLSSRYHLFLAGESHYPLRDATITNCSKWILFVCISTVSIWYLPVQFELQKDLDVFQCVWYFLYSGL